MGLEREPSISKYLLFSQKMPQVQLPGPASSGSQPLVALAQRDLMFSSSIHGHANTCICTYTYILINEK